MTYDITEHALWTLINGAGWWWWGTIAAIAGANCWALIRLRPHPSVWGRLARLIGLAGYMMIAFSWLNTAFGPLGLPLVLVSALWRSLLRFEKLPPVVGKQTTPERLASILVDPKDDKSELPIRVIRGQGRVA